MNRAVRICSLCVFMGMLVAEADEIEKLTTCESDTSSFFKSFSCFPKLYDGRRLCMVSNPMCAAAHDPDIFGKTADLGGGLLNPATDLWVSMEEGYRFQCIMGCGFQCITTDGILDNDCLNSACSYVDGCMKCAGNNCDVGTLFNYLRDVGWNNLILRAFPASYAPRRGDLDFYVRALDTYFKDQCPQGCENVHAVTHCRGGYGRTGMFTMSYLIWQIHKGNGVQHFPHIAFSGLGGGESHLDLRIIRKDGGSLDLPGLNDPSKIWPTWAALVALNSSQLTGAYENDCTRDYCNSEGWPVRLLELSRQREVYISSEGFSGHATLDLLVRRCWIACSLCGMGGGQVLGESTIRKSSKAGPARGTIIPRVTQEVILLTLMLRGTKAGELHSVNYQRRFPGNCMRLVQWTECLAECSSTACYKVTKDWEGRVVKEWDVDGSESHVRTLRQKTLSCFDVGSYGAVRESWISKSSMKVKSKPETPKGSRFYTIVEWVCIVILVIALVSSLILNRRQFQAARASKRSRQTRGVEFSYMADNVQSHSSFGSTFNT